MARHNVNVGAFNIEQWCFLLHAPEVHVRALMHDGVAEGVETCEVCLFGSSGANLRNFHCHGSIVAYFMPLKRTQNIEMG